MKRYRDSDHIIYEPQDFNIDNWSRTAELVVDGGLGVCAVCGTYEAGLDEEPCLKSQLTAAVRELGEDKSALKRDVEAYIKSRKTLLNRAEAAEQRYEALNSFVREQTEYNNIIVKERDELRAENAALKEEISGRDSAHRLLQAENAALRRVGEELADQAQIVMGCEFGSGEMIMQFCTLTEKVRQFRALDAGKGTP